MSKKKDLTRSGLIRSLTTSICHIVNDKSKNKIISAKIHDIVEKKYRYIVARSLKTKEKDEEMHNKNITNYEAQLSAIRTGRITFDGGMVLISEVSQIEAEEPDIIIHLKNGNILRLNNEEGGFDYVYDLFEITKLD